MHNFVFSPESSEIKKYIHYNNINVKDIENKILIYIFFKCEIYLLPQYVETVDKTMNKHDHMTKWSARGRPKEKTTITKLYRKTI